jgi:hypothetical protein
MNLKPRVRRLERARAIDADAWLRTLSDEELLFLLHYYGRAILADPATAAEGRAKVAADLAALPPPPCIRRGRGKQLLAHSCFDRL